MARLYVPGHPLSIKIGSHGVTAFFCRRSRKRRGLGRIGYPTYGGGARDRPPSPPGPGELQPPNLRQAVLSLVSVGRILADLHHVVTASGSFEPVWSHMLHRPARVPHHSLPCSAGPHEFADSACLGRGVHNPRAQGSWVILIKNKGLRAMQPTDFRSREPSAAAGSRRKDAVLPPSGTPLALRGRRQSNGTRRGPTSRVPGGLP